MAIATVVVTAIAVASAVLMRPPQPSPINMAYAVVHLSLRDGVPDAAYVITDEDLTRFPLIARVFQAWEDPSCCPEAEFFPRLTGTLYFHVTEDEVNPVHEYLLERFLSMEPDRQDPVVIKYQGEYFEWRLSVP